jgi:chromosomal replication initiator protein
MYLARELTPLSLTAIAREFGRDHTTVMYAIRAVSSRLEPGSETAAVIHRIRSSLGTDVQWLTPGLEPIHQPPTDPQD